MLGEIRAGIERIRGRDRSQAQALERWLHKLTDQFADRTIPIDSTTADIWGRLQISHPTPAIDGLLAASGLQHDLTIVTRDTTGFTRTGAKLLNPF